MALVSPQNAGGGSPDPLALTVQLNEADPLAPVVSLAVTVTLPVLAAVGVPEIRPEELMDSPAGNPVALNVSVCPDAESVAWTCRLTAVPTVQDWLPGLVTVTMFPVPPLGKTSMPLTWALSLTVTNWMVTVPVLLAVAVNGSITPMYSPPAVAKMSKLVRT